MGTLHKQCWCCKKISCLSDLNISMFQLCHDVFHIHFALPPFPLVHKACLFHLPMIVLLFFGYLFRTFSASSAWVCILLLYLFIFWPLTPQLVTPKVTYCLFLAVSSCTFTSFMWWSIAIFNSVISKCTAVEIFHFPIVYLLLQGNGEFFFVTFQVIISLASSLSKLPRQ